ncbi:MAG: GtrA family protein [Limisphaerales bacterium]
MKLGETFPGNGTLRSLVSRYARFCIVGGTGVGVDMAMIWLLASPALLNWNLSLSKIIAAEVAIVNNFAWNEVWLGRAQFRWKVARGWLR